VKRGIVVSNQKFMKSNRSFANIAGSIRLQSTVDVCMLAEFLSPASARHINKQAASWGISKELFSLIVSHSGITKRARDKRNDRFRTGRMLWFQEVSWRNCLEKSDIFEKEEAQDSYCLFMQEESRDRLYNQAKDWRCIHKILRSKPLWLLLRALFGLKSISKFWITQYCCFDKIWSSSVKNLLASLMSSLFNSTKSWTDWQNSSAIPEKCKVGRSLQASRILVELTTAVFQDWQKKLSKIHWAIL